ncbi:MAG: sugar transferase [Microthrixaceae bacterium]|nr:sugar transferase [Microthrixaceae bacterium]HMT23827.1 sugar transferase [Microthrixaceae bacterium]HMT62491.1 sugar transferase [Microthrixaceae bacterium]
MATDSVPTTSGPRSDTVERDGHEDRTAAVLRLPVRHADGPFAGIRFPGRHASGLRRRLVVLDGLSIVLAWSTAMLLPVSGQMLGRASVVALLVGGLSQWASIATQRLYLARVSSVRSVELSSLFRATVLGAVASLASLGLWPENVSGLKVRVLLGAAASMAMLALGRGVFNSWLRAGRARGQFNRPIVIVGTNDEAAQLVDLLSTHGELGFKVVGVTGSREDYDEREWTVPFVGSLCDTLGALAAHVANGVIVATSAMSASELNDLTRDLLRHDVHVHLSSGLRGIDHRRLRAAPIAHEPIFYLEPSSLSRTQVIAKRVLDVSVASLALLVVSPVLALAAVAVWLQDRGPILFKQRRIGYLGKEFTVYKMRTMIPDAEARLSEVLKEFGNQRDGSLFKLSNDPRRTRVGRVLEASSLDELPQLFNVLNGTMSLVGPRPALPSEVETFDDELLTRFSVPPGITGLWQVEARDNPSFAAYKRLDLFYVENWSVSLDLVLLIETATSVLARLFNHRRDQPAN